MSTPIPVTAPVLPSAGQLPLPFGAPEADRRRPPVDVDARDPEASPPAGAVPLLEPAVATALGGLGALSDPLARARAATALLAELETARLAVVALRRTAVVATGLSARQLAVSLDLSLGAACDLQSAARGRRRRTGR